jgi:hypothetical protein
MSLETISMIQHGTMASAFAYANCRSRSREHRITGVPHLRCITSCCTACGARRPLPSLASSTALIDTRDHGPVRSRNATYESCTLRAISPREASLVGGKRRQI